MYNSSIKRIKLKKISRGKYNWSAVLAVFVAAAIFGALYLFDLGNTPPVDNVSEQSSYQAVQYGQDLKDNILFGPHKVLQLGIVSWSDLPGAYLRLASVAFVLLAMGVFFILIKDWISRRVAILATSLFATSSWVIFDARTAEPEAMLLIVLPLLLLAGTMLKIKEFDAWLPLTTLLAAFCLYIPGVWVFVVIGTILVFKDLREAWGAGTKKARAIWSASLILPLGPLIYGLTQAGTLKSWLVFPPEGFGLRNFWGNIADLPSQLFSSGTSDALDWLPGTPIIDVVALGLMALGFGYTILDKSRPYRRYILMAFGAVSVLLIGVMGPEYISLLLPLIYVYVALGIALLLQQWFHVFPRNPVARSFGVVLLCSAIILSCGYHVVRYHYVCA